MASVRIAPTPVVVLMFDEPLPSCADRVLMIFSVRCPIDQTQRRDRGRGRQRAARELTDPVPLGAALGQETLDCVATRAIKLWAVDLNGGPFWGITNFEIRISQTQVPQRQQPIIRVLHIQRVDVFGPVAVERAAGRPERVDKVQASALRAPQVAPESCKRSPTS